MERLTGSFKVMHWEEQPYDAAGGVPTLARAVVTHELTGDIEGEASITYLLAYETGAGASYVGLVRITGRIGAREGTFVARDVGTFAGGVARSSWSILPGLSTGGLCGLRGEGRFDATHDGAQYWLDCQIDD